jgi:hypothetical protein
MFLGHAIPVSVSCSLLTVEAQGRQCGIYLRQTGAGVGSSSSISAVASSVPHTFWILYDWSVWGCNTKRLSVSALLLSPAHHHE